MTFIENNKTSQIQKGGNAMEEKNFLERIFKQKNDTGDNKEKCNKTYRRKGT